MTKKYLVGGIMFEAAANYRPEAAKDTTVTLGSSSSDDGLLPKELMNELYKNGIPTDVDALTAEFAAYEKRLARGLPVSSSTLLNFKAKANRVILQANYLKSAEEEATRNDSLGEVAVGSRGELFVYDEKDGIKEVALNKFDFENMTALTVGEILEARKFAPSQAFDTKIIPTVHRNLGMSKITDLILKIIATVGSTSTTSEAYQDLASYIGREAAKKPSELELLNLLTLYQHMQELGPDALFKVKEVMSSKNIESALNYIQSVLPSEMKRQLTARYVAAGYDLDSSSKYMQNIIAQALVTNNDVKNEHYINYDSNLNTASGTKAGSKDLNRNLNVLEQLVQGTLGKIDYLLISRKNPSASITLHGNGIGNLADIDNNIIDKTPLSIAMKAGLASIIDLNHVSIGDQKLPPGAFDTVLYNGGLVINIWAPVDGNGDIDFDQLSTFTEIQKYIEKNPQLTLSDKNQLLQLYGLDGQYDLNGVFHGGGQMAQFIVMTGLTSDEVVDPSTNIYSDKLSKQEKDLEMPLIERIYGQLNKGIKDKDALYKFLKGWFNFTTDLVKAPIFMKLNTTAKIDIGTFSDKGPLVTTPSYNLQIAYDLMRYARTKPINTPSTQLLYE